jgi:hypothetical protein
MPQNRLVTRQASSASVSRAGLRRHGSFVFQRSVVRRDTVTRVAPSYSSTMAGEVFGVDGAIILLIPLLVVLVVIALVVSLSRTGRNSTRSLESGDTAVALPNSPFVDPGIRANESDDLVSALERIGQLHVTGVLNDIEFRQAKGRLLGSPGEAGSQS